MKTYLADHNLIEWTPRLAIWLVEDTTWGMVNLLQNGIKPFAAAIAHALQHETSNQNRCERCCLPHPDFDVHNRIALWQTLVEACRMGRGQFAYPKHPNQGGALRFDKRTDKLLHPTEYYTWNALEWLCLYYFAKHDMPDEMQVIAPKVLENAASAWCWYLSDNGKGKKGDYEFLFAFGKQDTPSQLPLFREGVK